jgi:anti-sigma B factor antagonist
MEITVRELANVDVVTVVGRVDSSTAPQLDQTLKGLVDNGHFKLVLDLSEVDYMSSAGLRAMVSCLREVKKGVRMGDLRLANPSERVAEVLELAGLDQVFQVFEDQVGAVGSF